MDKSIFGSEKVEMKKIPARFNVFLIISVAIAALASMGDLTLSIGEATNITLLVLFLYIISRMIYHNVYVENVIKAKESEEYQKADAEYKETASRVYTEGLAHRIPELCLRYREEELRLFRSEILSDQSITYEIYEKQYRGQTKKELKKLGLSRGAIKCIRRANRAKGIDLGADVLLSGDYKPRRRGDIFHRSSEKQQNIDQFKSGATALLKTVLVGVISISVALDFSFQAIAQWAVRMMPIVTAVLTAAPAGQKNVFNVAIPYLKNKTAVLKTMLAWAAMPEENQKEPSSHSEEK